MRQGGIIARHLHRRHRSTILDSSPCPVAALLGRTFTTSAPKVAWAGDITYLPLVDGRFLYLARVIDLRSRRLIGYSIAEPMRAEPVVDALAGP
jgi:transposase InsO family protein